MIREASIEDLIEVEDLLKDFLKESPVYSKYSYHEEKTRWILSKMILDEDKCMFITGDQIINGVIGGFIGTDAFTEDVTNHDYFMYVKPEIRGSQKGKQLIEKWHKWGQSKNAVDSWFQINTNIHPEKTGRLFESCGFNGIGLTYRSNHV